MPSYLDIGLDVNPEDLAQQAFAYLMANIPGYVPSPGHLESFLIEALARMVNEARIVASKVPARIFAYLGRSILGLAPIDATYAQVPTTWTMQDNAGYTVYAGTHAAFKVAGDQLVIFKTLADFTVAPGSTTSAVGGVQMQAVELGAASSGIAAGAMTMVDSLAFVTSVVSTAATSGGVDAETDLQYLNRLAADLALLAPRPILPADFAVLAKNVAGVYRATAIDGYWPGRVLADGATTNGNATLTSATGAFTVDDVGRTVAGAGIPGGTTVLSVTDSTHVVMSANATATAAGVAVTLGAQTTAARAVTVVALDVAGAGVAAGVKTAVKAYLNAQREVNFHVDAIDPTVTNIAVAFTFTTKAGNVAATVKAAAEAAVVAYLSPANWGGGNLVPPLWINLTTVRYLEVATLLNNVAGLDYLTVLTLNGGTVDIALGGVAPLPLGTAVGTPA